MPPPTLAKNATEDAPNPKPYNISGSGKIKYIIVTPNKPRPTVIIPLTTPLENAICNAPPKDERAASVVRTLDLVATLIPI